jgi:small subunit ribosomal protein S11
VAKVKKKTGRKVKRSVSEGIVFIKATFNNTIITVTDTDGNVVSWSCGGAVGYKGSRKSTPFAAQLAAKAAAKKAMDMGMASVEVRVIGPGSGRESALRSIQGSGLRVTKIKDRTNIPHNGCRQRKRRRI